jgi:hypothetical protein
VLLRPLYESWLLRSTREPLAPWQRALLLRALQRDEALRSLAAELAAFSHDDVPADLQAPDLRARLRAIVGTAPEPAPAWRSGWALAGASLALVALAIGGLDLGQPQPAARVELAQVHQPEEAEALRLPTLTPTPTLTPSPSPSVTPTALPQIEMESDQP